MALCSEAMTARGSEASGIMRSQRARYGAIQEYTLNYIRDPYMISGNIA